MRKHREKMKQQQQRATAGGEEALRYRYYSRQQNEAYRKFEREFIRRIDEILGTKVN
jgi:parvulin-like peptidyl-prolyl isomerase